MDTQEVTAKLLQWMQEFVEVPNPSLGNWSPCPYARQARMSNNILIKQGTTPYADCVSLTDYVWSKEVVVFWYEQYDPNMFIAEVNQANQELMPNNIVVLEDHPDTEEIVSKIKMNFGFCPIIVAQQLDKLNAAADQLRSKGYYNSWSKQDLDNIVNWRYK